MTDLMYFSRTTIVAMDFPDDLTAGGQFPIKLSVGMGPVEKN